MRKVLVIGIVLLFVGASAVSGISRSLIDNEKKKGINTSSSEWRYPPNIIVPDDYPTIQEALDNAPQGSVIGVCNGTYTEQISINKNDIILEGDLTAPTKLIGENTNNSVTIRSINVTVTDFHFDFNASSSTNHINYVIECYGKNCKLLNNDITGYSEINRTLTGIYAYTSDYITISGNNIFPVQENNNNNNLMTGILLSGCDFINISFNKIHHCSTAINLMGVRGADTSSEFIGIICNKITQNNNGISFEFSVAGVVYNEISNNNYGITSVVSYPLIASNNIINNSLSLIFQMSIGMVVENNIINDSADLLVMMSKGIGVLAFKNYWGEPNYLNPRRRCLPIYAPMLFFPWRLKPYTIQQCWPD